MREKYGALRGISVLLTIVLCGLNYVIGDIGLNLENKSSAYILVFTILSPMFTWLSGNFIDSFFPNRVRRIIYTPLIAIIIPSLAILVYITSYNYELAKTYDYDIGQKLLKYWAITITVLWVSWFLTLARLRDINAHEGLGVLLFIPIANIILIIALCFMAGTVGTNQYGEDPKQKGIPKPPTP